MKLMIDISEELYQMCKSCLGDADCIESAIANGIPLADVRAEIVKAYEDATMYSCDEELSRFASRVCGILGNIGKVDFPQAEDIEPTVKGFVDTMDILDRICEGRKDE